MNFNINRLINQIKWDTSQYLRLVLLGFGVVFGVQLFRTFTAVIDGRFGHGSFHSGSFGFLLMLGGLIFTSMIFNEMNQPQSRQFYLTVPGSHLEKFVSKLLISTIGFVVFTVVSYWLFSVFNSLMGKVLGGYDIQTFNPFTEDNFELIKTYLVIQSVFLLGAIAFRRYSFLKVMLSLLVLGIAMAALWGGVFRAVFNEFFTQGDFNAFFPGNNLSWDMKDNMEGYAKVIYWLFWLALAPAMWVISYFKLSEKEV